MCYNKAVMGTVRVHSYAKLNLSLNITGIAEGYHRLDSFVCSVNLSDEIVLRPRKDKQVNVVMHGMGSECIPLQNNAAFRAGEAFVKKYGTTGADITVFKNIPVGAGMGGSSADAAGVLNGMAQLYGVEEEQGLKSLADALGSDTGYMLHGGFARMTGRGDNVVFLEKKQEEKLFFLLLIPPTPVFTAACYRQYDKNPFGGQGETERCIQAFLKGDYTGMGSSFFNALLKPACAINPHVQRAIQEISAFSPLGYGMSGSGSAVFALFETKELCEWAKSRYRGNCRAVVVSTLCPKKKENKKIKWRNPFVLLKEEQEGI